MSQTHLSFIYTQNYKNLTGQFNLTNLNIFIGSNGSGKSNLINCLKFLKDCITPVYDSSRGVNSFEDAISKFGGTRILDKTVESPAYLRFAYGFTSTEKLVDYCDSKDAVFDISLISNKKESNIKLTEEALYFSDQVLKELNFKDKQFYYYVNHVKEDAALTIPDEKTGQVGSFYHNDNNKLYHMIFRNNFGLDYFEKIPPITTIRKSVKDWQFYNANNMDLKEIRESEPKIGGGGDIYLSSSGNNLALVIENLISQDIDFEERLNEAIKLILPQTRRIRSIRSGRLSLTVEWWLEGHKEPFYLDELSDGTVRMLCWAVILHSPKLPSLIVIDEPELGLHVAWMKILAEWIKKASKKTQIIITTHSPDLLDNFTDCLENVLCFHSTDNQHFSLKTLSEESLESKLDEGWELGDLYRVGDPNIGGWPW